MLAYSKLGNLQEEEVHLRKGILTSISIIFIIYTI